LLNIAFQEWHSMTEPFEQVTGAEEIPDLRGKAGGSSLGFALEFQNGVALVTLTDKSFERGWKVERLALEVPNVRFPFDFSGGAEQFRHSRCMLRHLELSVAAEDIVHFLVSSADVNRIGIEQVRVLTEKGAGWLGGIWRVGKDSAPFTARFVLEAAPELSIRVAFTDLRVYGWMPLSPVSLVGQLSQALGAYGIHWVDAAFLVFHPVRDFLRWLLPIHGWKIPDLEGVWMDAIDLMGGRIRLLSRNPNSPVILSSSVKTSPLDRKMAERGQLAFMAEAEAYRSAEIALREGRLDEARQLYLGKADVEPVHDLSARRLLEVGICRPDRFDEVEDLVKDLLSKKPTFLPALLAQAVLQERRGDPSAGRSYEAVGMLCSERGEREDAAIAHLKAGELLRPVDLTAAVSNIERVVSLNPDHLDAMRTLAGWYEETQQWYRAIRMNTRLVRKLEKPAEVAQCHARMGTVCLERLGDLDQARKHLEAALIHDPDNGPALVTLVAVQQRRGQGDRAMALLTKLITLAQTRNDPSMLLEGRLKLASLWEDSDDPSVAVLQYEQILTDHPDHLHSLFRVGVIAAQQGRFEKAIESLSRLLELESSGASLPEDVIKTACMTLGRAFRERPEGAAESRLYLERVARLDAKDLTVWAELERLDRVEGNWPHLVISLEKKAELLTDHAQVEAAVLEAARVADRQVGDRALAERLYRRALQIEPTSEEATEALVLILRADKRWKELADLLVVTASSEPDKEVASARWAEVGQVRMDKFKDLTGAIEAWQHGVRLNPRNQKVSNQLLAVYREQKKTRELVDLVGQIDDGALSTGDKTALWIERAQGLEQLGLKQEAVESYQKVVAWDPNHLVAQRALSDLHFELCQWKESRDATFHVLDLAGQGGLSGPGRTELHRRLAAIETVLGNADGAVEQYRQVLAHFEEDDEAANRLAQLFTQHKKWEDLAAFFAGRAERRTGESAARLHASAAEIWREKLNRLEPAANQYHLAIEVAPESENVPSRLASLQRIYASLGQWSKVVEILNRRIALAAPKQRAPMYMAIGAIMSSRLHDPAGAGQAWEQALNDDASYRPALLMLVRHCYENARYAEAIAYGKKALSKELPGPFLPAERRAGVAIEAARAAWRLEKLDDAALLYMEHMEAFASRQYAGVDPEAVERLELLLRKQRRFQELCLLYKRWLAIGLTPERRSGLQRSYALLLFEEMDQVDEAVLVLRERIRQQPEDQAAVSDLLRMLRETDRFLQLVAVLEEQWELAPQDKEKLSRLEELAETYQLRLHQPEKAIPHLNRLLALGYRPALERLLAILRQEGMHKELADLLMAQARGAADPREASRLYVELSQVARDFMKDRPLAIRSLKKALDLESSPQTRSELLHLMREEAEPEELAELLQTCSEEEKDPERKRSMMLEYAELCFSDLKRRKEGMEKIISALKIRPEESLARRAQGFYEEDRDDAGVAGMQKMLVDMASDAKTKAQCVYKLAQIHRDRLKDNEKAFLEFEQAADLDPSWPDPLRDLGDLLQHKQDWKRLLDVWQRLAALVPAGEEKAELLLRCARISLDQLKDPDQGMVLFKDAAEESSDPNRVLSEAADRLEALGRVDSAADMLEQVASSQREAPVELLRRLAKLREAAGEERQAMAAYVRLLQRNPKDSQASEFLEKKYRSQNRQGDLARIFAELATRQSGPLAADTWRMAAELWMEEEEATLAESALRRALTAAPAHEESIRLLAEMLKNRQAWVELMELCNVLPDESLVDERLGVAIKAAWDGLWTQLKSREQELMACRVMLRRQSTFVPALQRAAKLLEERGDAEEAEAMLRRLDTLVERLDPESRYDLDLRLAVIDFARGKPDDVERRLKRGIAARPMEAEPRDFLHKLYTGGKRYADHVALLLDEAEKTENEEEYIDRVQDAAKLMEHELGDARGAAVLYSRILKLRPDNAEGWKSVSELWRLSNDSKKQYEACSRAAKLLAGEEQIQFLRRVARLSEELGKGQDDIRETWEAVLEKAAGDNEALDRLLEMDRRQSRYEDLDRHLGHKIGLIKDANQAIDLLRERVEILSEKLGRPETALVLMERLNELLPSDQKTLNQWAALLRRVSKWPEYVGVMEQVRNLLTTDKEKADSWLEVAGVKLEKLGDFEGAVEALRQAATMDSKNPEPLMQLRHMSAKKGDPGMLAESLIGLADGGHGNEIELRRKAALLYGALGNVEKAKALWARVLILDENDVAARRFLSEMLAKQDPRLAISHWRWLLDRPAVINARLKIRLKRWLVEATSEADVDERIRVLESWVESVPKDRQALNELIDLYRKTGNRPALVKAVDRLEGAQGELDSADLWIERADILLQEKEVSQAVQALSRALALPGEMRFEIAMRMAKIQSELLQDEEAAFESQKIALSIRPGDPKTLESLIERSSRLERWDLAAEWILALLERLPLSEKNPWMIRFGDMKAMLGDEGAAIRAYEQAMELDPAERTAYLRMEQALKKQSDPGLGEFYLKWARSEAAGDRKSLLLVDAARSFQKQKDPDRGIEALQESIQTDPDSTEAYELLAVVLGSLERWEDLLEILYRRRELSRDQERRVAIAFEMGEVCKEHLNDLARAASHFEFCLNIDPANAAALEELADIRYQQRSFKEAADLYDRLENRGLEARRFVVAFRRGEIAEAAGDAGKAAQCYRESIDANSTFIPSRQNLICVLERAGDWKGVLEAITRLIGVLPEEGFEEIALDLWRQLGQTHRRLLRFDEAANCFKEVLKRAPSDVESVRMLKEYFTNQMQWSDAVAMAQREIELEPEDPEVAQRWLLLGDLHWLRLHDTTKAEESYRQGIAHSPEDPQIQWKLWEMLSSRGDWGGLGEMGLKLLEAPLPSERAAEVHRVLAKVERIAENTEQSLFHLEKAMEFGKADLRLLQEAAQLAKERQKWGKYASWFGQTLELQLQQGADPDAIVAGYTELSVVYQKELHDIVKASAAVRRALELKPRDPELLRKLGMLYAADWETCKEAIQVFRELMGMAPTDPLLFRYLARLEAARGDMDRAAWYYAGLRFLIPGDQEAKKVLEHVGQSTDPKRTIQRSEWDDVLLHPSADCLLQRIMAVMAPYLEQLFPANFSRYNVRGEDLVDNKNYPTVAKAVEAAGTMVSGRPISVFVATMNTWQAFLESGGNPSLVIPRVVIERLSPAELKFYVSREVVTAAMGCVLPMKFSRGDLVQLLSILCKMVRPEAETAIPLPPTAVQYIEAIQKVTPPNVMEMVTPLLKRYALEPRAHDIEQWIFGVCQTAERAALLVCGDLVASLSVLTRSSEAAGGRELAFIPDRASLLQRDAGMLALFRFAYSEKFLNLRRELGIGFSSFTPVATPPAPR
jgi:golgin subfamily B member 1